MKNVRVAQLDRASDYGSEGREFESSRVHLGSGLDRSHLYFSDILISYFSLHIPCEDPFLK